MIKDIPINPKLSISGCKRMINNVDTIQKAKIAEMWLRANQNLTNNQYNDLMRELSYIVREIYANA